MSAHDESQEFNLHIQINYNPKGIQSVNLNPSNQGIQWTFSSPQVDSDLEKKVNQWLEAYSRKEMSEIKLPLDWTFLPLFTRQVLQVVARVPFGKLSTYGEIAYLFGKPQAARAVGGACGRNPFLLFVPCHRVLDAKHELRGFSAGGISVKKSLLIFEGSKEKSSDG